MQEASVTIEAEPAVESEAPASPPSAAFVVFPPSVPRPAPDVPAKPAQPRPASGQAPAEGGSGPVEDACEPRHGARRYAHGELLLAAFIAARRPLTFEDLAGMLVGTGARVSELVTWLAASQANGLIVSQGFQLDAVGMPVGPRLFVLSDEARVELRARRDRRRPRVAA
jgi:hypothetical protein